jgi:hypothetical protein
MNRAARRRATRGENIVAMPTGERIRVDDISMGEFPRKQGDRHRWVAIATFSVTNPGAQGPKLLDQNNLCYLAIGCYDCEEPWTPDIEHRPCPAPEAQ